MITFDDKIDVTFELQMIDSARVSLRQRAHDACVVRGMTEFYAALIRSVELVASARAGHQIWIIALTDGVSSESQGSLNDALSKLQGAAGPSLIIVGIDLPPEYKPKMETLVTVTEHSKYIDASGGADALDTAFETIAEIISNSPSNAL